jgi:hypothetical protein
MGNDKKISASSKRKIGAAKNPWSTIKTTMSTTWKRIVWWFIVHFLNKKVKEVQSRGFRFIFRKYTLCIKTDNDFWSMKFRSDFIASPMLFYIAEKNDLNSLFGYISRLYQISDFMCKDQGFVDGLDRELNEYIKRLEKRAESAAAGVSDEQEMANDAFMREVAKYDRFDKAQREKDREALRHVISEFKGKL